jgi:ABC-type nitrate/sulfonate/bicarbonate transport system substrate-binding protein
LKGICPDPIVLQTNWWPEPDHGLFFQLIGPNGQVDTNKNSYSGPLGSTGVNVEIRAGGPAIGFQTVTALEYQDDSILLGMTGTDEQIGASASQPTVAVLAWYAKNPQIFFWGNPDWNFSSVADIGKSGATVLTFNASAWLEVLEGKGLIDKNQVDTSYSGDPSRFVAADGNIVSQGFVTSEPYIYEHEVNGWMKPVKFLLLDKDVPIYQDTLAIRADKLESNRACLQRLIPLLQRAAIDYVKNPGPVNGVLVDLTSKMKGGTQISAAGAADAVQRMTSLGIVSNGPDGVFGSYDLQQVQSQIDAFGPVFEARGKTPKAGLRAQEIVTNEFLDKSIKL